MTTVAEPGVPAPTDPLVRVVRGTLADEELAALTAVLFARAAARPVRPVEGGSDSDEDPEQARWQRPERLAGYHSPVSWHGGPRLR